MLLYEITTTRIGSNVCYFDRYLLILLIYLENQCVHLYSNWKKQYRTIAIGSQWLKSPWNYIKRRYLRGRHSFFQLCEYVVYLEAKHVCRVQRWLAGRQLSKPMSQWLWQMQSIRSLYVHGMFDWQQPSITKLYR